MDGNLIAWRIPLSRALSIDVFNVKMRRDRRVSTLVAGTHRPGLNPFDDFDNGERFRMPATATAAAAPAETDHRKRERSVSLAPDPRINRSLADCVSPAIISLAKPKPPRSTRSCGPR